MWTMARKKSQQGVSRTKSQDLPKLKRPKPAAGAIYQLKITLHDVQPPIWRRVQVKDCTLDKLHQVIQECMGWTDSHLHVFEIGAEQFGAPEQWDPLDDPDVGNSRKVKLGRLRAQALKKLRYIYDMGDDWKHTIHIEKTLEAEPGVHYPRCIAGERACPPEDCGGSWGYERLLMAIRDPKHPEHEDMAEWIGGEFDAEAFDLKAVNQALKGVR
jgi:hypothetical protein